jgi:translation initiation factor 4E
LTALTPKAIVAANQWKENMSELAHFSSAEDFWCYFNSIPKPSQVFFDGDCRKKVGPEGKTIEVYSLFKKGIEPEWGDAKNLTGGEWFCRQYFEAEVLDLYWQNLVLAVVGETIEDEVDKCVYNGAKLNKELDVINGVRVVDKLRGYLLYKLEIWMRSRDADVKEKVLARLLDIVTDGQSSSAKKTHPQFEWKYHSA